MLEDYRFDLGSGHWHHHRAARQAPVALADVLHAAHTAAARVTSPSVRRGIAPAPSVPAGLVADSLVAGYLLQARTILQTAPVSVDRRLPGLPQGLEELREYHLPPACLAEDGLAVTA